MGLGLHDNADRLSHQATERRIVVRRICISRKALWAAPQSRRSQKGFKPQAVLSRGWRCSSTRARRSLGVHALPSAEAEIFGCRCWRMRSSRQCRRARTWSPRRNGGFLAAEIPFFGVCVAVETGGLERWRGGAEGVRGSATQRHAAPSGPSARPRSSCLRPLRSRNLVGDTRLRTVGAGTPWLKAWTCAPPVPTASCGPVPRERAKLRAGLSARLLLSGLRSWLLSRKVLDLQLPRNGRNPWSKASVAQPSLHLAQGLDRSEGRWRWIRRRQGAPHRGL